LVIPVDSAETRRITQDVRHLSGTRGDREIVVFHLVRKLNTSNCG
jgi:hypothetical protein